MAFKIKPKTTSVNTDRFMNKIVGEIRKSQSVTTYGPGSLVDFPRMSAIVDGIDNWETTLGKYNFDKMKIHERNLERILNKNFFIQSQMIDSDKKHINGISVRRFPEYCYCPECGALDKYYKIEKKGNNSTQYNREIYCGICSQSKNRNIKLIPSRFVVSCKAGHLSEFPYEWWVHRNTGKCAKPKLSIEISKSINSMDGIIIKCQCGAKENLDGIMDKGALHMLRCYGTMPWLGKTEDMKGWYSEIDFGETCENELRVLQRGANNVYYPSVVSAMTIPPYSSRIQRILSSDVEELQKYNEMPEQLKKSNLDYYYDCNKELLRCDIEQFYDELDYALGTVNNGYKELRDLVEGEYEALCDEDCGDIDFLTIESAVPEEFKNYIEQIKIVGRLREVQVIDGFWRVTIEDEQKAKLSRKVTNWLPGNELFGEGIFIRLNEKKVEEWEKNNSKRYSKMVSRTSNCFKAKKKMSEENTRYVLLHTLSHLIIRELTMQCGYTSASIKEKIYSSENDGKPMCGFLVYTASADSDGSLGGLARQGVTEKIRDILLGAIENASWCSNDPLCIESKQQGYAMLNYAACHACALLPETSCECSNVLLDRASIIGVSDLQGMGFFEEFIK